MNTIKSKSAIDPRFIPPLRYSHLFEPINQAELRTKLHRYILIG